MTVASAVRPDDEALLVARLRGGDGAAYAELVRFHGGRLLAVARRFLSNEEDARDAVQDAFLSAFKAIAGFDASARLYTWLHRIAINAALTKLRTRKRKPEKAINDLLPKFLDDGHQEHPAALWKETSEMESQRQETRTLVRQCIDQLPDDYRTILLLRDIEELNTDMTAELLGVSLSVVKTRLHRARQALRGLLDPYFRREAV